MLLGYDSSEDDDDEIYYDFGYSEPLVREKAPPTLPYIHTKKLRDELHSALEDSKKLNLFYRAIEEEDLEVMDELLSLGVPINGSGPDWTPLMKACNLSRVDAVRFLLEHGSDPNISKELFTSLMACCTHCYTPEEIKLECVRLLIQYGALVNAKDKYRTTALMHATKSGYLSIINELLEVDGIDVNIQDKEGWTAIFHAVDQNNIEIVKRLMTVCKLNIKDRYDRTPLDLAVYKSKFELAELLGYKEETVSEVYEHENIDSLTAILRDLPDVNGHGGFASDSQAIFYSLNYFKLHEISFPDFLNASNKDLQDIGIKFDYERRKILRQVIHQYHLYSWRKTSMQPIDVNSPLSLEYCISFAGNLVKHLAIGNASLKYLYTRISSAEYTNLVEVRTQREMIEVFVHTYHTVEKLKDVLHKILKHIEKVQPPSSSDYISTYKERKKEGKLKRFMKGFWYVVGATTTGFLVYHFKSRTH